MKKFKWIFFVLILGIAAYALIVNNVMGKKESFEIREAGIALQFSENGEITGLLLGESKIPFLISGGTLLDGLTVRGKVVMEYLKKNGSYKFTRTVADSLGHTCTQTDVFTPDKGSIRWEVAISSDDSPWTTAIISRMKCARPQETLIWAPWGSADFSGTVSTPKLSELIKKGKTMESGGWSDPLVPVGFLDRNWHYGNVAQICPIADDFVALPLFTLLVPESDLGLSLVLAPDDVLLNMDLSVSDNGQFQYTRSNYRIGSGRTLIFTMYLVPHEASWRGGLRFLTQRYPRYFDAPNPLAHQIVGCGAYSGSEMPFDVAKYKKMAFGFNWKLSDDFPYMGMFIPPVKDADEKWRRSCAEPRPVGKSDSTSCRQLNEYAKYMKNSGFSVLNYFNVTEYGKDVNPNIGQLPASKVNDPQLWNDGSAFMKVNFPNAWLRVTSCSKVNNSKPLTPIKPIIELPGGLKGIMSNCYGAAIVDPGDPDYQKFLLEQADRHIKLVPETDGICIDRTDWLTFYNSQADDSVSWVDGLPARSLYRSWAGLMSKLGPLMHNADKVILSNMMPMRLELGRELDGIFTEFGQNGNALNTSALLCMRKPAVAWTYNKTLQQPNPDSFMQRHLYLGVFPTAPFPYNNHCIGPDSLADQLYTDYGPLLNAMRGKKWVLEPNCVETTTQGIKVNLFEVPDGYVLPVTFGGKAVSSIVRLRNISGLNKMKITVLHPGSDIEIPVASSFKSNVLEIVVPLKRGCGMVKFSNGKILTMKRKSSFQTQTTMNWNQVEIREAKI
ncbi:MAG: hypothetical protein M0Q53_14610 [Prolixibacteraceae bacterium]|jgi:hypothetical protein|nr:hypothetical protein [Prolixibacteraceae bacterium]